MWVSRKIILSSYCRAVDYLPSTYASENMIAKIEAKITSIKQSSHISPVRCSNVLWEEVLRCGHIIYKAYLNWDSLQRFSQICNVISLGSIWTGLFQNLVQYSTFIVQLQVWTKSTSTTSRNSRYDQHKPNQSTMHGRITSTISVQNRLGSY